MELKEWRELATKTAEELKVAWADVVKLSRLREVAREEMNAQIVEISILRERLAAQSAELSQLSAIHSDLTDELSHVKSHHTAGATMLDDLKSVAGAFEHPA